MKRSERTKQKATEERNQLSSRLGIFLLILNILDKIIDLLSNR
ncbi:hypothetical protein STRDD10_01635 [Streptococcus sp. DD10]|uniref:Uncharacterized protein n=1 Tax=Streptococcus oralis TaxID=1303 RepID=A0A139RIQ5_STROR|nr:MULTISPECIES: hypothetical protein [Streptococcus]KXT73131.1 hypothetical protein STRDD10_01635 [Streptococcus sp. DD10]KXU14578.1 hypothetical protein SORDD17_01371 [Streptococcus oralis]